MPNKKILQFLWKRSLIRQLHRRIHGRVFRSDFEAIPGMTTLEERDCFYQLAKEAAPGHIADLGCWLGSTTLPLLKGLTGRELLSSKDFKVFAFDRFIWEPTMQDVANWFPGAPQLKEDASFKPIFEKNTSQYSDRLIVVEADLENYEWNHGPIGLLLIDAMKSASLTVKITGSFFPNIVTGGTIVFQDFCHYYTPWIHVLAYELRQFLQPVYNVPYSGSMVFNLNGPVTLRDVIFLDRIVNYDYSRELVNDIFEHSLSLVQKENKPKVLAAKAMWYIHCGLPEMAKEILEREIAPFYPHKDDDVQALRFYLQRK